MNFLKRFSLIVVWTGMYFPMAQANTVAELPTIRIMAESEMRAEQVGPLPFQEEPQVRQAVQHYVYKIQKNMQDAEVGETATIVNYQPETQPDMSQFSPVLQEYIFAVAAGLQPPDPTVGLFTMLKPLNINRNNAESFREGTMKVNLNDLLQLQQQIRDGLNPSQNPLFPR